MQGIAKAVLISIFVTIGILLLVELAFFFPWYMTLVTETFNLSQVAANDNYVKEFYYDATLDSLQDRPIFSEKKDKIQITVKKDPSDTRSTAIGDEDEKKYEKSADNDKPYRQRGEPITVEIRAVYPLSITVWGNELEREIPVSFSLTTIGLKHYKDLELDF